MNALSTGMSRCYPPQGRNVDSAKSLTLCAFRARELMWSNESKLKTVVYLIT
jgi:hypothetical protein